MFLIAGFLLGSLFTSCVLRWAALLLTSNAKTGGDFLGPPRRRIAWALPVVALLHPAPYFIFLVALVVVRQIHAESSHGWLWLFAGFAAAALFTGVRTASIMRKLWRTRRTSLRL
jgi:hypothetical protein